MAHLLTEDNNILQECEKFKFSGPTPHLLNQKSEGRVQKSLFLTSPSGKSDASSNLKITTLFCATFDIHYHVMIDYDKDSLLD